MLRDETHWKKGETFVREIMKKKEDEERTSQNEVEAEQEFYSRITERLKMEAECKALREDNAKLRDTLDKMILAENVTLRKKLEENERAKPDTKGKKQEKKQEESKAPATGKTEKTNKEEKTKKPEVIENDKETGREISQKRQRKTDETTDTETEDGFVKTESRKARKRTVRLIAVNNKPEEMETETVAPTETEMPNKQKQKLPEVPVWPQVRPNPNAETPEAQTQTQPPVDPSKPPPIVLHDKTKWTDVSRELNRRKINFARAKLTSEVQTPDGRLNADILGVQSQKIHHSVLRTREQFRDADTTSATRETRKRLLSPYLL
nr:chromo domain-containing protein cec-3-like [Leptinotarsa decemlineata]